ncbi:MAG: DUF302 domain-containing protein [Nannocystaceae bacterium]|nr:DUF302 domain-containing protein [Nannocystaceae bacterium]
MTTFGMRKTLQCGFDEALARVPEALAKEGFGVLTEIDMQATMAKKLGVEFRRYRILGACNPPFARAALQTRLDVGLLLPCNVVVYEDDEQRAVVMAIDPMQTMAAAGDPGLAEIAAEVGAKLARVLESLP